jgi:hypothetical protein
LRIFTYAGLVLRRIWAKRGLLFGSFLGAALVTALLVIVPLYESSIAAVDLRFSIRQAPPGLVNVEASRAADPYLPDEAEAADQRVAAAHPEIRQWYPTIVERTLSRQLSFVPLDPVDWLGQAAAWREEAGEWAAAYVGATGGEFGDDPVAIVAAAVAGDLPPLLVDASGEPVPLPSPPYPTPAPEATTSRMVTAPTIRERVKIVEGAWPEADGDVLQIVIGEDLARRQGLAPGDREIIKPFIGLPQRFEVVEIAGIGRPIDPSDIFWAGSVPTDLIYIDQGSFDFWTTSFTTEAAADPWLRDSRGFDQISAIQSWMLALDRESVALKDVDTLDAAIADFRSSLGRDGIAVRTGIPDLIESFDLRSVIFGGPVLAMLALVVVGALYFLIYMSALTIEREGPELALLRSRGASTGQTVGLHVAQSAFIAIVAATVAPVLARLLVRATGRIPPMSELTGGGALEVAQDRSLLPFIVAGGSLAFVSMGLAILPFARRSVLDLRALAARPTTSSVWQRYYLDVFLVVIAGILLFELRRRGLVDAGDNLGLDPFAVASPALFLFAGALILLRILPFLLRGIGWLLTRLRGMAALPGWHLGRNPVPYGRLALLIWITTGFGAFALTYAQTLETSYDDRAGFAAGADARILGDGVGWIPAPESSQAASVYRTTASARLTGSTRGSELVAARPDDLAAVLTWREDFGPSPAETLAPLGATAGASPLGVELPAGTTAIRIGGVVVPRSSAEQAAAAEEGTAPPPMVHASIRILDGLGRPWIFTAPPLSDEAWTTVDANLQPASARNEPRAGGLVEPLMLEAVWLEREPTVDYPDPLDASRILIDEVSAVTPSGETLLDDGIRDGFEGFSGFAVNQVEGDIAARAFFSSLPPGQAPPSADTIGNSPLTRPGPVTQWQVPAADRTDPVPYLGRSPEPLPLLVDVEAASLARVAVGGSTVLAVDASEVPAVIVGQIERLPTASDPTMTGVIVTDLDALLGWLNASPPWTFPDVLPALTEPQELWLTAADPDAAAAQVASQAGDDVTILTVSATATSFSSRPVQIGLVSILFVGATASVVLALAGVVGYVVIAVRRRAKEMGVLRALGFRQRGVTGTFAVEQLVVLGVGAVIGVAGGVLLMRLVLPFVQLGESAEEIDPPALLVVDPAVLGAYLAGLGLLLIASVAWASRRVSARDLSEVLREVER